MSPIENTPDFESTNHFHSNKSILDKISVVNGVLVFSGYLPSPADMSGLLYWVEARFSPHSEGEKALFLKNHAGNTVGQSEFSQAAIFRNNFLGGYPVFEFNGYQYYNFDFTALIFNYYIFSFVEIRNSGKSENYLLGTQVTTINGGLHLGYRDNTTGTLAHYGNDVNCFVDEYTGLIPRVWVCALSSRGFEIWINKTRVSVKSNLQKLVAASNGNFGRGYGANYFEGYSPGFALHLGNKSEIEIENISDYWNSIYKIY